MSALDSLRTNVKLRASIRQRDEALQRTQVALEQARRARDRANEKRRAQAIKLKSAWKQSSRRGCSLFNANRKIDYLLDHIDRLELSLIEATNPGIDMEEVKRGREESRRAADVYLSDSANVDNLQEAIANSNADKTQPVARQTREEFIAAHPHRGNVDD